MNAPADAAEVDAPATPCAFAPATLERRFQVTPAILHSINSEGRLIEVSDAWLAKFGYRREEVLGRLSSDFLSPASREYALREGLPEFFRNGRCDNVEYQMVCKDGRVLDVLLSAVLDASDAVRGGCSLSVITDVTALKKAERQLAEREALYKGIVESQTELVSLARPDGELCFVNSAYARRFNLETQELMGRNLFDFVAVEFRAAGVEQFRQVCASELALESENQIVLPDGQRRWMAWSHRAIADAAGCVTLIHSVGRDIDRRVVAEEQLKASEARYRLLADHSSDMVLLVRDDGQRMYASPACLNLLGWSPEEMLTMSTQDSIHPEDVGSVDRGLAADGDELKTLTYRMRRSDGTFIWVEAASQKISVAGQPAHWLLVVRDIEQRVVAERRLKESEASYRLLADNSRDIVFQLDHNLVRRYVSPASRDILGYEPSELVGRGAFEECHPEDAEEVEAVFASLLCGELDHHSIINRQQHRDGLWIWVEARLKTLRDPRTGAVAGIIGAMRDISLRKSIEDQLAQANRRLEILAARDALSGLANRRTFDETLTREHRRALRDGGSLALIMIDIDCFKAFNDMYGHPAGDECLRQVAGVLASCARRPADLVARYGGEEFAVLLPDTDEAGGAEVAKAMRLAVRELALRHEAGAERIVTISAGVSASGRDLHEARPDWLLKEADQALYRAKRGGRDRVVNASWPAGGEAQDDPCLECEASCAVAA